MVRRQYVLIQVRMLGGTHDRPWNRISASAMVFPKVTAGAAQKREEAGRMRTCRIRDTRPA
jgi:hypothetical protein